MPNSITVSSARVEGTRFEASCVFVLHDQHGWLAAKQPESSVVYSLLRGWEHSLILPRYLLGYSDLEQVSIWHGVIMRGSE